MEEEIKKEPAAPTASAFETLQSELLKKISGNTGLVTSANTGFDKAIAKAEKAGEAGKAKIESVGSREIALQTEQFGQQRTTALESRRGFATNMAALQQLDTRTEKSLRDLEQRKKELLFAQDQATADRVSALQVQKLEFQARAEQQMYSNLFSMAGLEQSINQQNTQKEQFTQQMKFNESSAMSQIALQYGLSINPNETLTTLFSRATTEMGADSPAALAIKQAKSTIDANNAKIAQTIQEINTTKSMSSIDTDAIADAINSNPSLAGGILAQIKDPNSLSEVLKKASDKQYINIVTQEKTNGTTKKELIQRYISDATLSASEKKAALNSIENVYGPDSQQPEPITVEGVTLPDIFKGLGRASAQIQAPIINFLFDKNFKVK